MPAASRSRFWAMVARTNSSWAPSRQQHGIPVRDLSQPTSATKSAMSGTQNPYASCHHYFGQRFSLLSIDMINRSNQVNRSGKSGSMTSVGIPQETHCTRLSLDAAAVCRVRAISNFCPPHLMHVETAIRRGRACAFVFALPCFMV
jgi:hypothetical protein